MITKNEVDKVLNAYDKNKITVGTLGSHSALNIFKGAKEEGFDTVCVCKKKSEIVYKRFPVADQIMTVEDFGELLDEKVQSKLKKQNTILVPHGSFNAYIGTEMESYITALEEGLRKRDIKVVLQVMQSRGGITNNGVDLVGLVLYSIR